ncbi:MAG: hypothetical protein U0797_30005 [Gemmataceae bacterium]
MRITGVAHSRVWGDWQFESRVREQEEPERQEYAVTWDEHDAGDFAVNRGGWRLTPAGDGGTLLVYTLQVEMRAPPTSSRPGGDAQRRLGGVPHAVRDEVARQNPDERRPRAAYPFTVLTAPDTVRSSPARTTIHAHRGRPRPLAAGPARPADRCATWRRSSPACRKAPPAGP